MRLKFRRRCEIIVLFFLAILTYREKEMEAIQRLPEEFWKELEKKKLHSLIMWKNEYIFSINDYRSIE